MNTFLNTEYWLEYLLNSRNDNPYINHSFFIGNKFIPLLQDGEEFYSTHLDDDKTILLKVKELALKHNIKRICVDSQIKSYLNISGYTCVLDLLNIDLSKGHKSAIKKAEKYLNYEVLTETNQFMLDYFEIAGKITRPIKTFEILQDWIQLGFGMLIKATCENKTAGYIYILHYNDQAYYFMSGVFDEYRQYNVTHYLQSIAFEMLKDKGIKYYELGDQVANSLLSQPNDKELSISRFKKNFGGDIVYKPKSEYFFNIEYLQEVMSNRIINYIGVEYHAKDIVSIPQA